MKTSFSSSVSPRESRKTRWLATVATTLACVSITPCVQGGGAAVCMAVRTITCGARAAVPAPAPARPPSPSARTHLGVASGPAGIHKGAEIVGLGRHRGRGVGLAQRTELVKREHGHASVLGHLRGRGRGGGGGGGRLVWRSAAGWRRRPRLAGWLHARTAPPLPHTLAAASSPSPQYTTVLSRLASRGSALASMPIFCVCTPNNAAPRRSVRQCVPRAPRARARSAPTCTNTSVDSEWLMMYSMALSPSESYSGTQYTL